MNMIKCIGRQYVLTSALLLGMVGYAMPVLADAGTEASAQQEAAQSGVAAQVEEPVGKVYILVNGKQITVREYNQRLTYTLKNKYYHGRVPEGKEEETRKELTDEMVNHLLLLEEAERRGFKPNYAKLSKALTTEEGKNWNKPAWQQDRVRLEAQIKELIGQKSMLDQLEADVKNVPQPTPTEVRAYYDQHLDLFTEPEKLHLSVILLKVDPGASDDDWKKAWDEAQKISEQIKGGADFAEMARKYSKDKTAKDGGDMGYQHRGRVPAQIQEGVDKFKVGEVSAPYKGLEGVSVFRLEDRISPDTKDFQRSAQRAGELFMRDKKDQAWKANVERLRSTAKIEVITQPAAVNSIQPTGGGN